MAREHAAGAETAKREHLLEGLGVDAAQHEIGIEPFADLIFAGGGRFMETDGQIEGLQRIPQWIVVTALPLVIDQWIGAQKYRTKTQLFGAAARFADGIFHAV